RTSRQRLRRGRPVCWSASRAAPVSRPLAPLRPLPHALPPRPPLSPPPTPPGPPPPLPPAPLSLPSLRTMSPPTACTKSRRPTLASPSKQLAGRPLRAQLGRREPCLQ